MAHFILLSLKIHKKNGIKIVDHVHFYGDKQAAERIKGKGISHYIFDVDLNKYSKIYQKNYSWFDGGFIMRPFTYQPRFCVKKDFSERKTKSVAMGTLTKCEIPDFIETYGSEYYQPRRKMIMDNASKYELEIDSYISEWDEKPLKQVKEKDIIFLKLYKKLYNYFTSGRQKSYFSFDMVDEYNEYKMFICPSVLLKYRIRRDSISVEKRLQQKMTIEYIQRLYIERLKYGEDRFSVDGCKQYIQSHIKNESQTYKYVLAGDQVISEAEKLRRKGKNMLCMLLKLKLCILNPFYRYSYIQLMIQKVQIRMIRKGSRYFD